MSFIGIVANSDDYEFIIKELTKNNDCSKLQFINLNENSIENMKNIKFETVLICMEIHEKKYKNILLDNILINAKYLLINTDINMPLGFLQNNNIQIITYGMNQKATVTASSIKDDEVLICLQRNIWNVKHKIIEMQEVKVKSENISNATVYNLLATFIIKQLYI